MDAVAGAKQSLRDQSGREAKLRLTVSSLQPQQREHTEVLVLTNDNGQNRSDEVFAEHNG
jgi:hypothetical protein